MTDASTPKVAVRTTLPRLPLPSITERAHIQTQRLLLRPLIQDDLHALFALRQDPEFMSETSKGVPDKTISETQGELDFLLSPSNENFIYGIFESGTLIGEGGIHSVQGDMGWPEIGYKLKTSSRGKGYMTEAMGALLKAWWELPREETKIKVHPVSFLEDGTVLSSEDVETDERVVAEVALYNKGSQRVLEKLGFRHVATWEEEDTQLHRLGQPIMMSRYVLSKPQVVT